MPAPLFPPSPTLICSCGSSGCGGVIESSLPWCYSQTLALTWGGVEAEVAVRRDRGEERADEGRRGPWGGLKRVFVTGIWKQCNLAEPGCGERTNVCLMWDRPGRIIALFTRERPRGGYENVVKLP